jgi:rare lipoprotein A
MARRFLYLFTLLLLLQGCSGHRTSVIETPQTTELKGWQKSYEVDGQRYNPLSDHTGFTETGIASWYGSKFHGRKTSNGETYNMYGLTAAHKTLPLGVYVKITRLDSGSTITVRVNDRGPFVAGRIIDLSFGAAQQLGIVDSGTAKVRIEALGYLQDETGMATYVAPSSYDSGTFAVQVGAFSSQANAIALAQQMRTQYGKASVVSCVLDGHTFYRVRAGLFTSLDAAEQEARALAASGFSGSFVVAFD